MVGRLSWRLLEHADPDDGVGVQNEWMAEHGAHRLHLRDDMDADGGEMVLAVDGGPVGRWPYDLPEMRPILLANAFSFAGEILSMGDPRRAWIHDATCADDGGTHEDGVVA